jgi:hypothetical protein
MLHDAVARGRDDAQYDEAWDYGSRPDGTDAQFFTLAARAS